VGQQQDLVVGADDTEGVAGVAEGVLAALRDEQFLEDLSTGRAGEVVAVGEVAGLAVLFEELEPVAVVVIVEVAVDLQRLHTRSNGRFVIQTRGRCAAMA